MALRFDSRTVLLAEKFKYHETEMWSILPPRYLLSASKQLAPAIWIMLLLLSLPCNNCLFSIALFRLLFLLPFPLHFITTIITTRIIIRVTGFRTKVIALLEAADVSF